MAQNGTTKPGSLVQMKKLQAEKSTVAGSAYTSPKIRRPNYHQIHSKPLPLTTYPLPVFIPHNPFSYLRIAYTIISHYLSSPTSHANEYYGYFDTCTRSVHITDPNCVRALWEMGFFGKGSLSRSEPTWLDQEKKKLGLIATSTSEEMTEQRRKERERMKRERARVEQAALLEQIDKENGFVRNESTNDITNERKSEIYGAPTTLQSLDSVDPLFSPTTPALGQINAIDITPKSIPEIEVTNEEHLQLSLEESFFLVYALGALTLTNLSLSNSSILSLFRQHSYFPPISSSNLSPDDPFLINYAVYHHYRSLGWVIREGLKFAVDFLLYESGPVFKHAAFAIMIVPSYTNEYWKQSGLDKTAMQRRKGSRDWTWMHCVNRVQTQVLKTLVLCYVDVPAPAEIDGKDVGTILSKYRIREFSITRWSANRNRG
jgi:tRNA-splicing endonuclease subunit Sen2